MFIHTDRPNKIRAATTDTHMFVRVNYKFSYADLSLYVPGQVESDADTHEYGTGGGGKTRMNDICLLN